MRKTRLQTGRLPGSISTPLSPTRARGGLEIHAEGVLAGRRGVVVVEVVDHLLDAHGIGGRTLPGGEHAADVGVGGGVDVDGEGRQRVLECGEEGVVEDAGVGFAGVFGMGDATTAVVADVVEVEVGVIPTSAMGDNFRPFVRITASGVVVDIHIDPKAVFVLAHPLASPP